MGDEVLDKQMLPVQAVFPPNVDRVTLTSKPIELRLPVNDSVNRCMPIASLPDSSSHRRRWRQIDTPGAIENPTGAV